MRAPSALIHEASVRLTGDGTDAASAWWLLFALTLAESRAALLAACETRGWAAASVDAAVALLEPLRGWDWSLVDRALEAGVDRDVTGAFYTPAPLASRLADALLERNARPNKVVDPACGSGGLLDAVLERLIASGVAPADATETLWGYDIDPTAVAVARWRLQLRAGTLLTAGDGDGPHIASLDTLLDSTPTDFDAVIANPPFGNAIEQKSGRTDADRVAWGERYPEAATGAYDKASLFVAWALRHTVPSAPVAMLVPRALLSAPYAGRLRARCEEARPLSSWLPVERGDWFDAASVHVVGLVWAGRERPAALRVHRSGASAFDEVWTGADPADWCVHTSRWRDWASLPNEWPALGELADVSASAAVGEAYDWRADVSEAEASDGHSFRLVTSGAIDPMQLVWGQGQRYLKTQYERPVVSVRALSERRRRQAGTAKVLVPGLSAVLEAAVDADGRYVGAVATLCVLLRDAAVTKTFPDPVFVAGQGLLFVDDPNVQPAKMATADCAPGATSTTAAPAVDVSRSLRSLALYLNSASARAWYLAHYGAQALAGGSVQLTAAKLRSVPVPSWVMPLASAQLIDAEANAVASRLFEAARLRCAELPIKRPPAPGWQAPPELVADIVDAGLSAVWRALLDYDAPLAERLWAASVVVFAGSQAPRRRATG